jgi:hypothetical protein
MGARSSSYAPPTASARSPRQAITLGSGTGKNSCRRPAGVVDVVQPGSTVDGSGLQASRKPRAASRRGRRNSALALEPNVLSREGPLMDTSSVNVLTVSGPGDVIRPH